MFALGIVWGHALFWTIAPLLGWSSYTFEPTGISCSFNWNDRSVGGVLYVIGKTEYEVNFKQLKNIQLITIIG